MFRTNLIFLESLSSILVPVIGTKNRAILSPVDSSVTISAIYLKECPFLLSPKPGVSAILIFPKPGI